MTRGEANTVCVGDEVRTIGNELCTVIDLEYVNDSDGNNGILATLEVKNTHIVRKTNLELTHTNTVRWLL